MENQITEVTLSPLPDEEFVDEIAIYVIPELVKNSKTKGWTASVKLEISWKEQIIHRSTHETLQEAVMKLPSIYYQLQASQIDDMIPNVSEVLTGKCFQLGCCNPAESVYSVIEEEKDPDDLDEKIRCFCSEHSDRGNMFGDDCNEAYEVIEQEEPKVVSLARKLPKLEKLSSVKQEDNEEKTEESTTTPDEN
jgi:hypothetical protein